MAISEDEQPSKGNKIKRYKDSIQNKRKRGKQTDTQTDYDEH
jgi:hypothetical protein